MSATDSGKYTLFSITFMLLMMLSILNFAPLVAAEEINPVNGIIHPKIDGIIAQANSVNFASEWEDATETSIVLQSSDTKISAVLRKKIVEDIIYLVLELPPEVSLDELQYLTIGIDRDNDHALSFGDLRLIKYQVAPDGKLPLTSFKEIERGFVAEVFDGANWIIPQVDFDISWGTAAQSSRDNQNFPGVVEIEIYLGEFDAYVRNKYPTDRKHWFDKVEAFEYLGFSLSFDMRNGPSFGYPDIPIPISPTEPSEVLTYATEIYVANIPLPLPSADFAISHIEITQATQDFENSFTIVKGKRTAFRVYFGHDQPDLTTAAIISLKISVPRFFGDARVIHYSNQWIAADSRFTILGETIPRGQYSKSFNVVLEGELMDEPFLVVEATIRSELYSESDPSNNRYYTTIIPEESRPLNVHVVNVPYWNGTARSILYPSDSFSEMQKRDMAELYPTSKVRFVFDEAYARTFYIPTFGYDQRGDHANNFLGERYDDLLNLWRTQVARGERTIPYPHQLHGFFNGAFGGGLSTPSWGYAWSAAAVSWSGSGSSASLTMAHEINHNLGDDSWGRHVTGFGYGCGAPDGLFSHDGVWEGIYGGNAIQETGWKHNLGSVTANKPELMTYCRDSSYIVKWINGYRWERLFDRINRLPLDVNLINSSALQLNAASKSTILEGLFSPTAVYENTVRSISGQIWKDGTVAIDPSFEKPGIWEEPPALNVTPDIFVNVKYANGTTFKFSTGISFMSIENEVKTFSNFRVSVPDNGEIVSFTLLNATTNALLASVDPSGAIPDGFAQYPTAIKENEKEFDINVSYFQNVTTNYARAFYTDGNGWIPISGITTSDLLPVSLRGLPGGSKGQIHVLFTDGISTSVVAGPTMTVEHNKPKITITTKTNLVEVIDNMGTSFVPEEVKHEYPRGELIHFQAESSDEYGWEHSDSSYSWKIYDNNNVLLDSISGSRDLLFTLEKPGRYVIAATVADPFTGLESTDSVIADIIEPKKESPKELISTLSNALVASINHIENPPISQSTTLTSTKDSDKTSDAGFIFINPYIMLVLLVPAILRKKSII